MSEAFYHFGVKGMKWGVRRYQNSDGTLTTAGQKRYAKKQTSLAKKDAKEYARAKMFYGEGAGVRRRLINNTVKQRSKDPTYKKAFDDALANQDMAKHATKARSERKRKDAKETVAKTGRGVVNVVTGHPERVGAAMASAVTAYGMAHKAGVDKKIADFAKQNASKFATAAKTAYGRYKVNQILNR